MLCVVLLLLLLLLLFFGGGGGGGYNNAHIPCNPAHSSFVMKRLLKINRNSFMTISLSHLAVTLINAGLDFSNLTKN